MYLGNRVSSDFISILTRTNKKTQGGNND